MRTRSRPVRPCTVVPGPRTVVPGRPLASTPWPTFDPLDTLNLGCQNGTSTSELSHHHLGKSPWPLGK